jgi:hypothetical protein
MEPKKIHWLYRVIRWLVWLFSPKFRIEGRENIPDEACVIVGNHSQMYGPISAELYTPVVHDTWCAGEMMDKHEVAEYAYHDFWAEKPFWNRWFFWLVSRMIGPLAELIFTNADTVAVYHDARVMTTFRRSMESLKTGSDVVIFPEKDEPCNAILYQFHEHFTDLAMLYSKRTGIALRFVPMYISPRLKSIHFGEPLQYRPDAPAGEERERLCRELIASITGIAASLPEHTVVPYRNIPKKLYPLNTDTRPPMVR